MDWKGIPEELWRFPRPTEIWVNPWEWDKDLYPRLCACRAHRNEPHGMDAYAAVHDLYGDDYPSDLFLYLLPLVLAAWRDELMEPERREYTAFSEMFCGQLEAGRLLARVNAEADRNAIASMMADTIVARIARERRLHHEGSGEPVYNWFSAMGTFARVFGDLHLIWEPWWSLEHEGHGVAALQYASTLLYDDASNPLFAAWTCDRGGGPPPLYESAGLINEPGWRDENIAYVVATLTWPFLQDRVRAACDRLQKHPERELVERVRQDLEVPDCAARARARLKDLPRLLAATDLDDQQWSV